MREAGLSKHLRLLARAGALEFRREGYYVLYSLVPTGSPRFRRHWSRLCGRCAEERSLGYTRPASVPIERAETLP